MSRTSPRGRADLLRLARASVSEAALGRPRVEREMRQVRITDELERRRGAFVTLEQRQAGVRVLRGCIGNLGSTLPLYRNVIDVAAQSATSDPRFPPIREEDLNGLHVEISVLSQLRTLDSADELEPGRHGVELVHRAGRAVFLPRVAVEQKWSREEWLRQLARKAGLPGDDWRGAELRAFEAEAFTDD